MLEVRTRILHVLANVGGDCALMLQHEVNRDKVIAWDRNKFLQFIIPFKEANAEIVIDELLPRILELAETSPDRKIKVAAGELLHAITLLMIGKSAEFVRDPTKEDIPKSPFHKIYTKVFPVILRLAVDVDKVTRNLFRTLTFQLVHWLTKNQKYENPETMAMLSTCLDAATSSDGPIRDFGAECSAEFLKYSIKHSAVGQLPKKRKITFQKIVPLLPTQWVLKAIRLYKTFREDSDLVNNFTFEILYNLLCSLRSSADDNPALGTSRTCQEAIGNFAKIIDVKHVLFLKSTKERRYFPGLESADLSSLVEWLFMESGKNESEYAHQCMELFFRFTIKITRPKQWLEEKLNETPKLLIKIYEPFKNSFKDTDAVHPIRSKLWLNQLCTALDGYTFLLEGDMISPASILSNGSMLLQSIGTFIHIYGTSFKEDYIKDMAPQENRQLDQQRAITIVKIFLFLEDILLRSGGGEINVPQRIVTLWNSEFFQLVAYAVFKPILLGFRADSQIVQDNLRMRMKGLLVALKNCLSQGDCKVLARNIANLCFEDSESPVLDWTQEINEMVVLIDSFRGLLLLLEAGMLEIVVSAKGFVGGYDEYISRYTNMVLQLKDLKEPMLVMAVGSVLELLLRDPKARWHTFATFLDLPTKGPDSYFGAEKLLKTFESNIIPFVYQYWDEVSEILTLHISSPIVGNILVQLFDHLLVNKVNYKDTLLDFMGKVGK
ncbi:hypothetical protein HK096_005785, partial [Nowakowskiella sp. JEL0078]